MRAKVVEYVCGNEVEWLGTEGQFTILVGAEFSVEEVTEDKVKCYTSLIPFWLPRGKIELIE